ncbi:hypothetical protein IW261DRAFT_1543742 [Armillaria novae-zelandiae]|uniref:Uncharacterized protein n=1 Tax=Armillaria novae-zelandiae TaxID=153914 RepID=A0AA39KEB3_9AGAR|nr:hypothetical protein IW261DRAFT_1543742 [Armillaria novae-zelandiae]
MPPSFPNKAHFRTLTNDINNPPNYPHPQSINIFCMPKARKLLWDTLFKQDLSVAPETRQFISSFPAIEELHFFLLVLHFSDDIEFLSLFKNLQKLELNDVDFKDGIYLSTFQCPGARSALKNFSIKDRYMPADWIVEKVFAVSPPKNLRCITCESNVSPFFPREFACLLDLS